MNQDPVFYDVRAYIAEKYEDHFKKLLYIKEIEIRHKILQYSWLRADLC